MVVVTHRQEPLVGNSREVEAGRGMFNVAPRNFRATEEASGVAAQLSSAPPVSWDEQLALTISQDSPALAYNVTAVQQSDVNGYGPAYLLNGLTDQGYWYQVGIAWNWAQSGGGYSPGFKFLYEAWNPSGSSVYPVVGGAGLKNYTSKINAGDSVLLNLYFSNNQVVMYSKDWNTSATASVNYTASGGAIFVGLPGQCNSNCYFSGLMTEQYHAAQYLGTEAEVTYTDPNLGLNAATMWIDEYNVKTNQTLFSNSSPDISYSDPNQLQYFSLNGTSEASNAYEFITGSNSLIGITLSYSIVGGGAGYKAPTLDYVSNGTPMNSTLSTSPTEYFMDKGTNWTVTSLLNGSSSIQRWITNQTAGNATINQALVVSYLHEYILSFGPSQAGSGTVQPSTTGWYEAGVPISISAEAKSPYLFSNWVSNSSKITFANAETANTTTTINGAGSITAKFTLVTISISSNSGSLTQGSSVSTIAKIIGNNESVTLSVLGLPSDVTISWTKNPITDDLVGVADTLNISTSYSSPSGIYNITVKASSTNGSDSIQFTLKINTADPLTVSFSTSDSSSPNPPTITYVCDGTEYKSVLTNSSQVFYVDNGSSWHITTLLTNSSSTQRWILNGTSQSISNGPSTINFVYYHQFLVGFVFRTLDNSSSSGFPSVTITSSGASSNALANGTGVWADSGTKYSFASSISKSSTERWELAANQTGFITQEATISATYNHQYFVTSSFALSARAVVSTPPKLSFESNGTMNSIILAQNATSYWIDSGSKWSASANLSGSSAERLSGTNTSGIVNSKSVIRPEYTPQFYVVVKQNSQIAGSTSPQQGWYVSNSSLSISAVSNQGWKFVMWNGAGGQINSSSTKIIVTGPMNITAEFYAMLSINSGSSGHVTYYYGSNSGTVSAGSMDMLYVPPGTNVSMSASSDSPFYTAGSWSTGNESSGSSSPFIFTVSSPMTVGASFDLNFTMIALIGAVAVGLIAAVAFLAIRRGGGKQFTDGSSHTWKW